MCVVLVLCLAMQFKSLQIIIFWLGLWYCGSLNLQLHFNSLENLSFIFAMWCAEHSAIQINAPSPTVLLPTFCQFWNLKSMAKKYLTWLLLFIWSLKIHAAVLSLNMVEIRFLSFAACLLRSYQNLVCNYKEYKLHIIFEQMRFYVYIFVDLVRLTLVGEIQRYRHYR